MIESVNVKSHDQIVAELLGRPGVRAEVDRMERAPDSSSKPANLLPQYEADEGALTIAQLTQIKRSAPKVMNTIGADSTAQNQVLPIPAIEQGHDIHLSQADQEAFAKALLLPEPPNAALKNATAKANEFLG